MLQEQKDLFRCFSISIRRNLGVMEELPKTEVTPSKLSIGIGFVIHLLEKNRKKVKSRDIWRE